MIKKDSTDIDKCITNVILYLLTYYFNEVLNMAHKNLIISAKRFRGDSSVVSVRLPVDMIDEIDSIAAKTGRTRNEIIQKCLAFSIENLEISDNT